MNIRPRRLIVCMTRRPWTRASLGLWVAISVFYYRWLMSRNSYSSQNRIIRSPPGFQTNVLMKRISNELTDLYNYQLPQVHYNTSNICETIHVSLVCMSKCTRKLSPMIKSLLHHRQSPIHFHLIVDNSARPIFDKLFETWDLPDVKYSLYSAESYSSYVEWIPTTHYSGKYARIKLLLPDILPQTLKRVIVLDSDLTILTDIAELWELFKNMTDDQFLGLIQNESNFYPGSINRWPALGRGYNNGVMLWDLEKIRNNGNWTDLWSEVIYENIPRLKEVQLADQDIINALIKKYPKIVFNISCQYNVQMSIKSIAKSCYGVDAKKVKIIHWNSLSRYYINIEDADFFRTIHQTYVNFDGNLLKRKLYTCWSKTTPSSLSIKNQTNPNESNSELCASFRATQRERLRTHIYYMDYAHEASDDFDVTLVTQLSVDRLQSLKRLIYYWSGPLSVAIYLKDCEVGQLESSLSDVAGPFGARRDIGYHLVFKHDAAMHYPVNYLRNVALEHARTPYVFLMDVDFVPMDGLYDHLRAAVRLLNPYPQKKCLVVPAFETQRYRASPPRSKQALLARLAGSGRRRADVAPFRALEWPRGHRATNYTRWANATAPYEVEWESDYEPYLVVHRSVPKYDTRFSGFGCNKVSHMVELRAQGYRAVVLPAAFVLHTAHALSADKSAFLTVPVYRVCLALLKQEFLEDLKRKYNVTFEEKDVQLNSKDKFKYNKRCLALLKQEFLEDLKRKYNVTFEEKDVQLNSKDKFKYNKR